MQTELDIGTLIELEGNRYQVIGTDLASGPHPSGVYKKWDYLLKRTDSNRLRRVTKEELSNFTIIGEKE